MHLAEIVKPSWWASSLLHCLIISVPSVLQCWLEIESFIFSFLIYNFLSVRTNYHRTMNLMLKISPWNKNISIQFNFYPIITVSSNDTSVWAVWKAKTKICGVSHHFQALFYSNANTPTRGNLIYLEQNWTIFISPASNLCSRSTAEENDGSQGLSSLLTQREYWITSTIFSPSDRCIKSRGYKLWRNFINIKVWWVIIYTLYWTNVKYKQIKLNVSFALSDLALSLL